MHTKQDTVQFTKCQNNRNQNPVAMLTDKISTDLNLKMSMCFSICSKARKITKQGHETSQNVKASALKGLKHPTYWSNSVYSSIDSSK